MNKPLNAIVMPIKSVADHRADFPIFEQKIHGKPLVFLDSAASAQKPRQVIDAMAQFLSHDYANIHRGVYDLSARATAAYEGSRAKVARFINAGDADQIIFTKNTTEAINLVANSYGTEFLKPGDEIILTQIEHHANIVPWQLLRERTGIVIKVAPVDDRGALILDRFAALLGPRTKLVSCAHISNALGTILPIEDMITLAHKAGAHILIDGSQGVVHGPVDVQALDADFYVFTGHKLYGPSGIGVLYGKKELLAQMPPWQGGGDMIRSVTFEHTEFADPPQRFEAGTPPIAEAVGLGAAIDYVSTIGMNAIAAHEQDLLRYATEALRGLNDVRLIGTAPRKAGIVSFLLDGIHPHDLGTILDKEGVAVRTGNHCAQPAMDRFDVPGTARASLGLYNSRADIDALVAALGVARKVFGR